jgi:hypothetical protein
MRPAEVKIAKTIGVIASRPATTTLIQIVTG